MGLILQPDERPQALLAYLAQIRRARQPFRPGRWDCALFAAGWIRVCTGRDLASEWRGGYRSLAQGKARIATLGGLEGIARRQLRRVDPDEVIPGDVVLLDVSAANACGIFGGAHIHVLATPQAAIGGLDILPRSMAVKVFRP
jgi:hypothetical protein